MISLDLFALIILGVWLVGVIMLVAWMIVSAR